jgi:hypothetical protein
LIKFLIEDIHVIKAKLTRWLIQQRDMGYNVSTLFDDLEHVDSLQSVLNILFKYFAQPIHAFYALSSMGVIEEVDVNRNSWNDEEKIRTEILVAWARQKFHLDDDDANILRI